MQDEFGAWRFYHDIRPIWEDDLEQFGRTRFLLAHARSAFRDEGICVENNMPFADDRYVFIFNGELQGVRIRENGRIGAEKIFNYVKRFDHGDMHAALLKGVSIIERQTRFVRAMNMIIGDGQRMHVSSLFNDDPEYFTMHHRRASDAVVVCSQPYGDYDDWTPIANHSVQVF